MIEHPDVIPIAVVTAVTIFIIKETLEWIRRESANTRKIKAVKRLVAAECERNHFSIGRLKWQIKSVDEALQNGGSLALNVNSNKSDVLRITRADGGFSQSPIPLIYRKECDKYLFEIASLDTVLFKYMESHLDALTEAEHVRESFSQHVKENSEFLSSFMPYAIDELDTAHREVRHLYKRCAKKELSFGRVR